MSRGSAAELASVRLTGAEFGVLVGISERRVRELRDQGALSSDERGRYGLENVAAYCAHLRPAAGKAADGGSESGQSLDAARVRLVTAQAQAREMLNTQLRGEVVLSEDLDAIVGGTFDAVRTKTLAIPSAAAARIVGLTDRATIQEELTSLIHDALADLAETEVVAAVKDRARRRAGRGIGANEADSE